MTFFRGPSQQQGKEGDTKQMKALSHTCMHALTHTESSVYWAGLVGSNMITEG